MTIKARIEAGLQEVCASAKLPNGEIVSTCGSDEADALRFLGYAFHQLGYLFVNFEKEETQMERVS